MNTFKFLTAFGLLAAPLAVKAEPIPLSEENWEFKGTVEAVEFKGKQALKLENGRIDLKNHTFKNGIIEFDILFPEIRGFTGVVFRINNAINAENFYFRPHQGGNEDANQYQPIFNGNAGWQIYYGPQYSTATEYNYDEWMHVKVLVKDDKAEFYLDSDEPFLHVDDLLLDAKSGGVSFTSAIVGTHFANIEVTETDDVALKGEPVAHKELPENLVTSFEVAQGAVGVVDANGALELGDREWIPLDVERNGIANLARINGVSEEARTTLVRLKINSDKDQIKTLKFGYSDKASVFLNGWPVAGGDNTYMSRDYRYLGTVGLFDEVYLNLREGENEVIFAVTEAFGGWAVMAQFPDMEGISLIQ